MSMPDCEAAEVFIAQLSSGKRNRMIKYSKDAIQSLIDEQMDTGTCDDEWMHCEKVKSSDANVSIAASKFKTSAQILGQGPSSVAVKALLQKAEESEGHIRAHMGSIFADAVPKFVKSCVKNGTSRKPLKLHLRLFDVYGNCVNNAYSTRSTSISLDNDDSLCVTDINSLGYVCLDAVVKHTSDTFDEILTRMSDQKNSPLTQKKHIFNIGWTDMIDVHLKRATGVITSSAKTPVSIEGTASQNSSSLIFETVGDALFAAVTVGPRIQETEVTSLVTKATASCTDQHNDEQMESVIKNEAKGVQQDQDPQTLSTSSHTHTHTHTSQCSQTKVFVQLSRGGTYVLMITLCGIPIFGSPFQFTIGDSGEHDTSEKGPDHEIEEEIGEDIVIRKSMIQQLHKKQNNERKVKKKKSRKKPILRQRKQRKTMRKTGTKHRTRGGFSLSREISTGLADARELFSINNRRNRPLGIKLDSDSRRRYANVTVDNDSCDCNSMAEGSSKKHFVDNTNAPMEIKTESTNSLVSAIPKVNSKNDSVQPDFIDNTNYDTEYDNKDGIVDIQQALLVQKQQQKTWKQDCLPRRIRNHKSKTRKGSKGVWKLSKKNVGKTIPPRMSTNYGSRDCLKNLLTIRAPAVVTKAAAASYASATARKPKGKRSQKMYFKRPTSSCAISGRMHQYRKIGGNLSKVTLQKLDRPRSCSVDTRKYRHYYASTSKTDTALDVRKISSSAQLSHTGENQTS